MHLQNPLLSLQSRGSAAISGACSNVFYSTLYPSFKHPCLEGSGDERIQEIVSSIDAIDVFSDEAENLQTILADAKQVSVDSDGRVILPHEFVVHAGISDLASFVGLGKSFQIWSPKNFSIHRQKNRLRAREQGATLRIISSSSERS